MVPCAVLGFVLDHFVTLATDFAVIGPRIFGRVTHDANPA